LLWQVTYLSPCISAASSRPASTHINESTTVPATLHASSLQRYSQDISPTASHSTTPAHVQHDSDEATSLGPEQFREVMQAHHNRQVPIGGLCLSATSFRKGAQAEPSTKYGLSQLASAIQSRLPELSESEQVRVNGRKRPRSGRTVQCTNPHSWVIGVDPLFVPRCKAPDQPWKKCHSRNTRAGRDDAVLQASSLEPAKYIMQHPEAVAYPRSEQRSCACAYCL
jgi:hypothetical protein